MEKRPLTKSVVQKFIGIGVAFLLVGVGLVMYAPSFSKSNVDIAKSATNAKAAAQAISANNQKEMMVHMVGMGILGAGVAFVGFGALSYSKIKKED